MRFRTECLPVVLVVSATTMTMPLVTSCKKEDAPSTADASRPVPTTNGPIIIRRNEDIPPMMGGIAAPYEPPPPPSSSAAPPPPAQAPQGIAPQGIAPQGIAPLGAAPAAAAAPEPAALAIKHNHPPDQPCNHPLKREEVEKALSDLKAKSK